MKAKRDNDKRFSAPLKKTCEMLRFCEYICDFSRLNYIALIEKAGYEKESKTIFDTLLFFIIIGRYTVPEVIDFPRYNMIVAGKT